MLFLHFHKQSAFAVSQGIQFPRSNSKTCLQMSLPIAESVIILPFRSLERLRTGHIIIVWMKAKEPFEFGSV